MRQRNTSGSPLVIPAIPAEVPAGGEINYRDLLAGFEPVPAQDPDADAKPAPKSTRTKATAPAADAEEAQAS